MQFQGVYNTGFPFPGQAPPSRPSRVQITNQERGVYNSLLAQADSESTGRIEGRQAVEFFKKSGLPVEVLKKVWELATPNGESFLDRERFYVSMRLIALAQEGTPLNQDTVHTVPKDYPKFSSGSSAPSSWSVPDEDKMKYSMIFDNTSYGKGYLTGMEAKEIFQRTELTLPDLKQVWDLVDTDRSGKLNKNQFIVAMHIINRRVNGRTPVPDRLPSELKNLVETPAETQAFGNLGMPAQPSASVQPPKPKDPMFDFGDVTSAPVIKTNFQTAPDSMLNLAPPQVKTVKQDGLLGMGMSEPVRNIQQDSMMGMGQSLHVKPAQPVPPSNQLLDDWETVKDMSADISQISIKSDKSGGREKIPKEKHTFSQPKAEENKEKLEEEIEEYKYKILEQAVLDKQQMLRDKENMLKFYKSVFEEDKLERESLEKLNKELEARVKEMEKAVSKMLEIFEKTQKLAKRGSFNITSDHQPDSEVSAKKPSTTELAHPAHSHSKIALDIPPVAIQSQPFEVPQVKAPVKQISQPEISNKPTPSVTTAPQLNNSTAPQTAVTDFEFPKSFGYGSAHKDDLPDLGIPKSAGIESNREFEEKNSSLSSPGVSTGFEFAKATPNQGGFDFSKAGKAPSVSSSFDFGGKQSAQVSMQSSFDFSAAKKSQDSSPDIKAPKPSQPPTQASFDFSAAKPAQPPIQASFDFSAAKPAQPPIQASFDFNAAKPVQPPIQASFDFSAAKPVQPPIQASFDFSAAKPVQPPIQASFDFSAAKPVQPPIQASFDFSAAKSAQPPIQASFDFSAAKPAQPQDSSFTFDSDKPAKDSKESLDFNMDKQSFGFNFNTQSRSGFTGSFADFDSSAFSTAPANFASFQEGVFSLDPSKITQKPSSKQAFDFS
jgi:hypothetical protein